MIQKWLEYLGPFIVISLAMITGIWLSISAFRRKKQTWLIAFSMYLTWSLILQWIAVIYVIRNRESNAFIINISNCGELSFFCWLSFSTLPRSGLRLFSGWITALLVLFAILNISIGQGFYNYDLWTFHGEAVSVIIFSLLYFYNMLQQNKIILPFSEPLFWIFSGLFFFFWGDIGYFLIFDYILNHGINVDARVYRYITLILDIAQYTFFAIGFIKAKTWMQEK